MFCNNKSIYNIESTFDADSILKSFIYLKAYFLRITKPFAGTEVGSSSLSVGVPDVTSTTFV